MVYTDLHRHVLQTFTREFSLTQPQANAVYHEFCQSKKVDPDDDPPSLDHLAREINDRLHKYQMGLTIKKRKANEIDGQIYWTLINKSNDKISQIATVHKDWVMPWFKQVVKFIVRNDKGYITSTEAIHLAQRQKSGKRIKGAEVESKLRDLHNEKWLHETDRAGYFTAGIRTLVELDALLIEYGAHKCPITQQLVISTKRYRTWLKDKGHSLQARDFEEEAVDPHADDESAEPEDD